MPGIICTVLPCTVQPFWSYSSGTKHLPPKQAPVLCVARAKLSMLVATVGVPVVEEPASAVGSVGTPSGRSTYCAPASGRAPPSKLPKPPPESGATSIAPASAKLAPASEVFPDHRRERDAAGRHVDPAHRDGRAEALRRVEAIGGRAIGLDTAGAVHLRGVVRREADRVDHVLDAHAVDAGLSRGKGARGTADDVRVERLVVLLGGPPGVSGISFGISMPIADPSSRRLSGNRSKVGLRVRDRRVDRRAARVRWRP